jgi:hypothetical protein
LIALLGVAVWAAFAAGEPGFDRVFQPVLGALQQKCPVRLRLPAHVPDLGQGNDPVYGVLGEAAVDRYTVYLAFTPDCNGASVCRIASFSAGPAGKDSAGAGGSVRLPGGRRGVYSEAECGANCSDAVVRWREGAVEYTVGVKGGSRADVVRLANACF